MFVFGHRSSVPVAGCRSRSLKLIWCMCPVPVKRHRSLPACPPCLWSVLRYRSSVLAVSTDYRWQTSVVGRYYQLIGHRSTIGPKMWSGIYEGICENSVIDAGLPVISDWHVIGAGYRCRSSVIDHRCISAYWQRPKRLGIKNNWEKRQSIKSASV